MLDHLGMTEKGTAIRQGIRTVLETRRDMVTPDMGGTGTTELGAPSGDVFVPILLAVVGAVVVIGVELVATRLNTEHA